MKQLNFRSQSANGSFFEDAIDGYFPLRESLRQLLNRNHFQSALIFLVQAPAMEIPGLSETDPVPLYLNEGHGCLINHMALMTHVVDDVPITSGIADWKWWGNHRLNDRDFSEFHRLAEPAFVRGIGFQTVDKPVVPQADEPLPGNQQIQISTHLNPGQIVRGNILIENKQITLNTSEISSNDALLSTITSVTIQNDTTQQRILDCIAREF